MLHSVMVRVNVRRKRARSLVTIFRPAEGILNAGAHIMREPAGIQPAGQEEGKGRVTVTCLVLEQVGSQVSAEEEPTGLQAPL